MRIGIVKKDYVVAEERTKELTGFGIANYRSFDEEGFVVEGLKRINVFIGKNNSGKSNILRTIRLLKCVNSPRMSQGRSSERTHGLGLDPNVDSHDGKGTAPSIVACVSAATLIGENEYLRRTCDIFGEAFRIRWNTSSGAIESHTSLEDLSGRDLVAFHAAVTRRQYQGTPRREQVLADLGKALIEQAISALDYFHNLVFVENFREIRAAPDSEQGVDSFNGFNVIAQLREMQVPGFGNDAQRDVFDNIQLFVGELLGDSRMRIEIPQEDVILVKMRGRRLPLDSYGTGVHQLVILCAALAMHTDYVVCIEEPEIHIHPDLQRKFLRFIANETDNRYFITTHSNVYLDLLDDVGIHHVTHDGVKSTVTPVIAKPGARDLLADLGYKASDLLQANCLLWVEGPSDRVYINKWLELMDAELQEGIHYSITFYGGSPLFHFTAIDDPEGDLVEVLSINQHAIFVMDRDEAKASGRLNETKERIRAEVGDERCWVTAGREIENYLRPTLINEFLMDKIGKPLKVAFAKNARLEKSIATALKGVDGPTIAYAKDKVGYARIFAERMTSEDLDVRDLREQMERMVRLIRGWNGIVEE